MQNSQPVEVNVAPGMSFEAPLVVELLLATGLGATVAWVFSLWSKAQFVMEFRKQNETIEERDNTISELKDMVVELESSVAALPPSKRAEPTSETIEAKTQEAAQDVEQQASERMMA
ncbi:MAG: LapA family protein [Synechococcus sp.]